MRMTASPATSFYRLALTLSSVVLASSVSVASALDSANSALDDLHAAILADIVQQYVGHERSACPAPLSESPPATSFSFEFPGNNPASDWHPDFIPYESSLFQAIMSHDDPVGDKSWSIRVGTGGNIYSHFVQDMWGETLPPQRHGDKRVEKGDSPWVDEVSQSVAVNTVLNQINREYDFPKYCDGDPRLPASNPGYGKCKKMYIHQAGAYQRDDPYTTDVPFFSPSLARHCDGRTCTFAGWGTSAHVATPFTSSIIYINSYRDCGNGILEHTQMVHNMANPKAPASAANDGRNVEFDFFNVPWAGVRPSNLPYALEPNAETDTLSYEDVNDVDYLNLCRFGGENIYGDLGHDSKPTSEPAWRGQAEDLRNLAGYTTFAMDGLLVNHTAPTFTLPCRDERGPSCEESAGGCMVSSCTDDQIRKGTHTRIQLKVAPNESPACEVSSPPYDNTYNQYVVLQCNMRDKDFGQDTKGYLSGENFPCAPWIKLGFVNSKTSKVLEVPYVRHFSWSPKNRRVYFAVHEMDADNAINLVDTMFDNRGNDAELPVEVRTFHGRISSIPRKYNPGAIKAFTFVYGRGEDFGGGGSIKGRVQRRVGGTESGPGTRDYTVFTVRWFAFGARLEPGSTYASRIYNFHGDLSMAKETADGLRDKTFSGKIDPELWSPRVVDAYRSGDHFAVVAARSARGRRTACGTLRPTCSGKSTPGAGLVPYFYITCGAGALTHFGSDPYHFAPSFGRYPGHGDVGNLVRSYVCKGQDMSIRPTWKLVGFFPARDRRCELLATSKYNETVFNCRAADPSSTNPSKAPSKAPAAAPSGPPTISPLGRLTKSPTEITLAPEPLTEKSSIPPTSSPTKVTRTEQSLAPPAPKNSIPPTTSPSKTPLAEPSLSPTGHNAAPNPTTVKQPTKPPVPINPPVLANPYPTRLRRRPVRNWRAPPRPAPMPDPAPTVERRPEIMPIQSEDSGNPYPTRLGRQPARKWRAPPRRAPMRQPTPTMADKNKKENIDQMGESVIVPLSKKNKRTRTHKKGTKIVFVLPKPTVGQRNSRRK